MGGGEDTFRILSKIEAWNITEDKAELKINTQRKGKSKPECMEKAHSQGSTVLPCTSATCHQNSDGGNWKKKRGHSSSSNVTPSQQ